MRQMIYLSNAANGYAAHDELEQKLHSCLADGYLSTVIKEYRVGLGGYSNAEQFYAPFMIQFCDRQRWIVYSTTSCRTDRIKGQQWDAENLKRVDASIVGAYLVYPDDTEAKEVSAFSAQLAKYVTRAEYSCLDGICSFSELIEKIKQREDAVFREEARPPISEAGDESRNILAQEESDRAVAGMSIEALGRDWDFQGRSFERTLAQLLSNEELFSAWNTGHYNEAGVKYFKKVMQTLGVNPGQVAQIVATSEQEEIGLLPNGGQPKTDVLVRVSLLNGEVKTYTISCKRTNRTSVSAHQYTADDFADVLDAENIGLRNMLHAFQRTGTLSGMDIADGIGLTTRISPYVRKLCEWVIMGEGGRGNPVTQFARYLAVYRPIDNRFVIHPAQDYINTMMNNPMRHFGTPFMWTFASGQRGRSIQLKMPIYL